MVDFLLPPLCLGCGKYDESGSGICDQCAKRIIPYEQPICLDCFAPLTDEGICPDCGRKTTPIFAYADYQEPLREIVINFKFRGIRMPALHFARQIREQFLTQINDLTAIALVPVPLYRSRERGRGYNQAAEFAGELGKALELPVTEDIVVRVKRRKPQSRLAFKEREENIRGVFAAVEPATGAERFIIVDDVVTSGATVREVRRVLEQAGHTVVAVIAMAHGQ